MDPFEELPDDVLCGVLARLPPLDLLSSASLVNSRWRRAARSAALWSIIGLPLASQNLSLNKAILAMLETADDRALLSTVPFYKDGSQKDGVERDMHLLKIFSRADSLYFGSKFAFDRMMISVGELAPRLRKWTAPHVCLRADVEPLPALGNLRELTIAFSSPASMLAAVAATPLLERLVARFPPASGMQASPQVAAHQALLESAVPPAQQHDLSTVSIMGRLGAGGEGRALEELGLDCGLLAARCPLLCAFAIEFPSLSPRAAPAEVTAGTFAGLAALRQLADLRLEHVALAEGALDALGDLGLRSLALAAHIHALHAPLVLAGRHHPALERLSVAATDPQGTAAPLHVSLLACGSLREVSVSSAAAGAGAGTLVRVSGCARLESVRLAGREAGLLLEGDPAAACPGLARLDLPRLALLALEHASTAQPDLRVAHAALRELRVTVAEIRVPATWTVEPTDFAPAPLAPPFPSPGAPFTTPMKRAPREALADPHSPLSPTQQSPCTPCQRGPAPASPGTPCTPADAPIARSVPYPVVHVHCPALRSLSYRGPAAAPRPALALSESTCGRLEALRLHSTAECNTGAWLAAALVLHKPLGLTDAALAALVAHLPRLASLELARCPELREPSLEPANPRGLCRLALSECPALRTLAVAGPAPDALELADCPRLARSAVEPPGAGASALGEGLRGLALAPGDEEAELEGPDSPREAPSPQ
eukprot:tig00000889_g5313.t1